MIKNGFHIHKLPDLKSPVLIAGFGGWGNALQMSTAMAAYIVHKLKARKFAEIDPDVFFRYDEMRPQVRIEEGIFKGLDLPEGEFFAARLESGPHDVVILKADEPNLRWRDFAEEFFTLCLRLNIRTVITLGSMYDHVLHTDRIISAIASGGQLTSLLNQKGVNAISYQGPSAIHSMIHARGIRMGLNCMSFWCHCPFYMQGSTHYGLLVHLGNLLAAVGGFELNVEDLEKGWEQQNRIIENQIQENPKLRALTDDLIKVKKRGMISQLKRTIRPDEKIINIQDFLNPE